MNTNIVSLIAGLVLATTAHSAVLGTYTFDSPTGYGPTANPNLTYSDFSFHGTTSGGVVGGALYAENTGNVVYDTYIQFTVTAENATLDLTQLTFTWSGIDGSSPLDIPGIAIFNTTGVGADVEPGLDSNSAVEYGGFPPGQRTFVFEGNFTGIQGATVRFYLDQSPSGSGANFDNVFLEGDVTPVPEPINVALALFGFTFAGIGIGRRLLKKKA